MPISLATIREAIAPLVQGKFLEFSTTTDIAASKLVISTALERFPQDNYFDANWSILIKGTANDMVVRNINSYDASAYQLTVYGANLAAESAAKDFELWQFDPDLIKTKINEARLLCWPLLHVPILCPNDHFKDWSQTTYPDHWRVSEVTAVKETGAVNIHNGAASAKVTRAGTDGSLYISTSLGTSVLPVDIYNALFALRGQKVKFAKWVKTSTALQARLMIYCGSDARTWTSPYHSGGGSFELLEVEADIPLDASEVGFRCEVKTTNGDVYFDGVGSGETPSASRTGYLSSVSADTDEMELNTDQALPLEYWAAALILRMPTTIVSSEAIGRYAILADQHEATARRLLGVHKPSAPEHFIKFGWQADWPGD